MNSLVLRKEKIMDEKSKALESQENSGLEAIKGATKIKDKALKAKATLEDWIVQLQTQLLKEDERLDKAAKNCQLTKKNMGKAHSDASHELQEAKSSLASTQKLQAELLEQE
jgi:hypothetical protein